MAEELKCTLYCPGDWIDEVFPSFPHCHCPVCGGFIKWEGENVDIPICNKCETELIALPDHDEETGEKLETGRICPIAPKGGV